MKLKSLCITKDQQTGYRIGKYFYQLYIDRGLIYNINKKPRKTEPKTKTNNNINKDNKNSKNPILKKWHTDLNRILKRRLNTPV